MYICMYVCVEDIGGTDRLLTGRGLIQIRRLFLCLRVVKSTNANKLVTYIVLGHVLDKWQRGMEGREGGRERERGRKEMEG